MNWLDILRAEVAKANDKKGRGGKAKVARAIGVSRTAVSLVLAGKYADNVAASTDRIAARVLATYGAGHVYCPHLQAEISIPKCGEWRRKPMPRSNPADIRHWIACRDCPVGKALAAGKTPAAPNAPAALKEATDAV